MSPTLWAASSPAAFSAKLHRIKQLQQEPCSPARKLLIFLRMLIVASLVLAGVASTVVVAVSLVKAPEGYEDRDGFHFIKRPRAAGRISGSRKQPAKSGLISLQLPRLTR